MQSKLNLATEFEIQIREILNKAKAENRIDTSITRMIMAMRDVAISLEDNFFEHLVTFSSIGFVYDSYDENTHFLAFTHPEGDGLFFLGN